jgi:peptide/nickel transport system permease protein
MLSFGLLWLAPGDPTLAVLVDTPSVGPSEYAALHEAYGLDHSPLVAYATWLRRVVSGDLGYSSVSHRPVLELVRAALPNTIILSSLALLWALVTGVFLGLLAAQHHGSWIDALVRLVAVAGHALPAFWIALLYVTIVAVQLRAAPTGGVLSLGASPFDIADRMRHLVGPVLVLSLAGTAHYARLIRTELLEILGSDYILNAHAKGLATRQVLWRHALRGALIPVVTSLGGALARLVSGALVVEQVFAWPGMGRLAYDAARGRDAPVLLASVLLVSVLTVVGFLLRDVGYILVDPRAGEY